MNASELFEAGQLQVAIQAQTAAVKADPANAGTRLFFCELLFFAGDFDRAEKQLDAITLDEPAAAAAIGLYQRAIAAERVRRQVLVGQARPRFLDDVPDHVEQRLHALKQYAAGDRPGGDQLLDQANQQAPTLSATLNGEGVDLLRDGDDLFATVLEVHGSNGQYCWVPLEQVESLSIGPPRRPRDLVFVPAHLVLRNGSAGDVLLPGLYPDTHQQRDDQLRLGRAADWVGGDDAPVRGVGARVLLHAGGTMPLVEIRELAFASPPLQASPQESE